MEEDVLKKFQLKKFQEEMEFQCRLAVFALDDLKEALGNYDKAYGEGFKHAEERIYIFRIYYFIEAFLVAAANISKLLDPIEPRRPRGYPRKEWKIKGLELWKAMKERGVELRKSLSVGEDSPLIKLRPPRDYMEHFDAYLQQWIEETKHLKDVTYAHRSIGPLNKIKELKDKPELKDFLQFFDYEQYILVFRGAEYPLKRIIEAVKKLLEEIEIKTSTEQKKGCQWS